MLVQDPFIQVLFVCHPDRGGLLPCSLTWNPKPIQTHLVGICKNCRKHRSILRFHGIVCGRFKSLEATHMSQDPLNELCQLRRPYEEVQCAWLDTLAFYVQMLGYEPVVRSSFPRYHLVSYFQLLLLAGSCSCYLCKTLSPHAIHLNP